MGLDKIGERRFPFDAPPERSTRVGRFDARAFDPGDHEFAAIEMPSELERLCLRVAASEGLVLAGFDFRVTDDDVWYCLEVNPVPTFITYQAATRQEIGEAVVDRLLAQVPL